MQTPITMTTVEIAAMTGKQHKNVLRDADRAIELVTKSRTKEVNRLRFEPVDLGATEATYLDGKKEARRMLVLNKQMVFTLITGYDTALRFTVVGRWIELEQAANPAFGSQAITDTLNDLQTRVDMMAPAYEEHTRKGRTVGYSWREACRLAGIEHPDLALSLLITKGRARKTPKGFVELHPDYAKDGLVKVLNASNLVTAKNGGHLFKITAKGLQEWLTDKAEVINRDVRKSRDMTDQWGKAIK